MDNVKNRKDTVTLNEADLNVLLQTDREMVIFYLENVLGHDLTDEVEKAILECPKLSVPMVNGDDTPWNVSPLSDN